MAENLNLGEWPKAIVWDEEPSTRQSTSLWLKHYPINVTLTTPGTAQDVFNVRPIVVPTVNLCTNPSFETGAPPTGYTAVGSALAQVGSGTVAPYFGTYSMEINPSNAAAGEGAYYTITIAGGAAANLQDKVFSASCYFRDLVGSGNSARVRIYVAETATSYNGNTVALANAWGNRSVAVFNLATFQTATLTIYLETALQHNTTFYADGFQLELRDKSPYCDGDQSVDTQWDGTAHASISRRRPGIKRVRGYSLSIDKDAYIGYDTIARSTAGFGRPVSAGMDWWTEHSVNLSRISLINKWAGEQPTIIGEVWGI